MATAFETETCPRCLGTGHYSRNAYGSSACYTCKGGKVVLTKRGMAARRHFFESTERRADTLVEGHLIWWTYDPYGKPQWRTIGSVRRIPPNVTPAPEEGYVIELTTSFGAKSIEQPRFMIRSVESMAERDRLVAKALAFQATLGANGKPAKAAS